MWPIIDDFKKHMIIIRLMWPIIDEFLKPVIIIILMWPIIGGFQDIQNIYLHGAVYLKKKNQIT